MSEDKRLERANRRIKLLENMVEATTRKLYMKELAVKQARQNFERIIETMLNALVVTDDEFRITTINKAAETLFGFSKADLWGESLLMFLQIPEMHFVGRDISKLDGIHKESKFTRPIDDVVVPVLISLSTFGEDGASGLVCVISDISESQALERRLMQAQKLESVGQLAAGLAHELNTPIQYVRDNTRFISEEFCKLTPLLESLPRLWNESHTADLGAELKSLAESTDIDYLISEIPTALKETLEGAERVSTIITSMKLFSHPGVKEKIQADLNALIESTLTVSTNEWKYVADVELSLDPDLPLLFCDPGSLGQALLNIIVNASHAVGAKTNNAEKGKGNIRIATSCDANEITIRISDDGTGIPVELKSKIFDPFFTTKDIGKGTGQGLSMTHTAIVELHKGSIDVESSLGVGTTFILTLPLHTQESELATEPQIYVV